LPEPAPARSSLFSPAHTTRLMIFRFAYFGTAAAHADGGAGVVGGALANPPDEHGKTGQENVPNSLVIFIFFVLFWLSPPPADPPPPAPTPLNYRIIPGTARVQRMCIQGHKQQM